MSEYIHFTQEEKDRAYNIDLEDFLTKEGERLYKSGKELYWLDGTAKVSIRGNLWYHQYERVGGAAIAFVQKFYNKTYAEAVQYLLEGSGGTLITSPSIPKKEPVPFTVPEQYFNMRRVYSYLVLKRGIDKAVFCTFRDKGMLFEDAKYHNAVFAGFDGKGVIRHIHKRGTNGNNSFKGNQESSTPEYSFHWNGRSKSLFFFEAPIDMLSFIAMNKTGWQNHNYAASCGVSDRVLFQMLKDNPNIQNVYLCLDNDEAGQKANKRISEKLTEQGINYKILVPTQKDWNEDLLHISESEEVLCPVL